MSKYDWLLFLHVLGAFAFLGGAFVAGSLYFAAMRRQIPSQIAMLLGIVRISVPLIGIGALLTIVFGIWLAENAGYGVGDEWVVASIVLWVMAQATGWAGGNRVDRARVLAERVAAEGDQPSAELRANLRDPLSIALNYGSGAVVVAILVLMVWKPGAF